MSDASFQDINSLIEKIDNVCEVPDNANATESELIKNFQSSIIDGDIGAYTNEDTSFITNNMETHPLSTVDCSAVKSKSDDCSIVYAVDGTSPSSIEEKTLTKDKIVNYKNDSSHATNFSQPLLENIDFNSVLSNNCPVSQSSQGEISDILCNVGIKDNLSTLKSLDTDATLNSLVSLNSTIHSKSSEPESLKPVDRNCKLNHNKCMEENVKSNISVDEVVCSEVTNSNMEDNFSGNVEVLHKNVVTLQKEEESFSVKDNNIPVVHTAVSNNLEDTSKTKCSSVVNKNLEDKCSESASLSKYSSVESFKSNECNTNQGGKEIEAADVSKNGNNVWAEKNSSFTYNEVSKKQLVSQPIEEESSESSNKSTTSPTSGFVYNSKKVVGTKCLKRTTDDAEFNENEGTSSHPMVYINPNMFQEFDHSRNDKKAEDSLSNTSGCNVGVSVHDFQNKEDRIQPPLSEISCELDKSNLNELQKIIKIEQDDDVDIEIEDHPRKIVNPQQKDNMVDLEIGNNHGTSFYSESDAASEASITNISTNTNHFRRGKIKRKKCARLSLPAKKKRFCYTRQEIHLPKFLQEIEAINPNMKTVRKRKCPEGRTVAVHIIFFAEKVIDWCFNNTYIGGVDNSKSFRMKIGVKGNFMFNGKDTPDLHPVDLGELFPFSVPGVNSKASTSLGEEIPLPFPLEHLSNHCPDVVSSKKKVLSKRNISYKTINLAEETLNWAFKETLLSSFEDSPILVNHLGLIKCESTVWPDTSMDIFNHVQVDHTFPFGLPISKKHHHNILFSDINPELPAHIMEDEISVPSISPIMRKQYETDRDSLVRLLALASYYVYSSDIPTIRTNPSLSVVYSSIVASFYPLIVSQANRFGNTIFDIRKKLLSGFSSKDKSIIPALINGAINPMKGFFANVAKAEKSIAYNEDNKLRIAD